MQEKLFLPQKGGLLSKGIHKAYKAGLPLVTIITSVWNGSDVLENAILSVLNQGYPNVEYVVIDGGSTDGSVDIIKKYEDKIDFWVTEKDTGIYDAWNKGIANANGEWIGFIGADDICLPGAIESLVNVALNSHCKLDYISGRGEITWNNVKLKIGGEPWEWQRFRHYVCTAQAGALHNISLYREVGNYDESFKIVGDYELLLRKGDTLKAGFVPAVTVSFALGGVSNNNIQVVYETHRAKQKHKTLQPHLLYYDLFKGVLAFYFKKYLKI